MLEHLTRQQMMEKYPNRWLGINNIIYTDAENTEIQSADIVYTDKDASELGLMSLQGQDVQPYFTTPDDAFPLGVIGGLNGSYI